jgi:PAS domain S-box-containing protein
MFFNPDRRELSRKQLLLLNFLLPLLYLFVGNIGLFFSTYNASSAPMWPLSGLALAMVLIFGFAQSLPGITVGVALLSLQNRLPGLTTIGLVSAAIIECIVASVMLHATGNGRFRFKSPKDIFVFVLAAAILSPFISSTVSVTSLFMGGLLHLEYVPKTLMSLFIGNSLGILVFTPFIYSFTRPLVRPLHKGEGILLLTLLIVIGYWAFEGDGIRKFIMLPLLTWAALRFSLRGVSIAAMIVGFIAIWRSTYLWGVFDDSSPAADLLWIQCFTAGSTIVGYFMATVVEVQEDAQDKKVAEEALAILDQSINKSPIGFALIDKDYKFIRINETLAAYNGFSPEFHLNKSLHEILGETSKAIEPLIDEVFMSGESLMNLSFTSVKLNKALPVSGQISYYPVRHPATNEIFGVGVTFQDMTDQVQIQNLIQENQDFLTFAQEAGKIGAFEWDLESRRILWTTELENIYGLSSGEFGGFFESWLKWIHPEDIDKAKEEIYKVLAGENELNLEFRIITQQNDVRWILARGKLVKNLSSNIVKLIGINIDLTEQKNIENKLRLTEANLLHALSVRDEFVAIASHELKTPLTSLKLQGQMYQRGILRNDPLIYTPEKIQSLLEKNSRELDRLTRLVDDMLDISRIRTGKLSIRKEHCELSSMLRDILGRTREQFENSGSGQPGILQLDEAFGEWDPLRIEQVMTNIITNAIRYGQGRPIKISIKNYQESVRFSVTDEGLGIPKSDQAKIFQRYERGLIAREVSGLGLGLFITQQIVDAHGGKIWVESEINKGSTFFVDLPRTTLPLILSPQSMNITQVTDS